MEQGKGNTQTRKGKHLNWNERILIEGFLKAGMSESNIAKELKRDRRTINREVERGLVEHLNSDLTALVAYNADRVQDVHDLNASAKGPPVKLKANSVAVEFIRCHIVIRRWSAGKEQEAPPCSLWLSVRAGSRSSARSRTRPRLR